MPAEPQSPSHGGGLSYCPHQALARMRSVLGCKQEAAGGSPLCQHLLVPGRAWPAPPLHPWDPTGGAALGGKLINLPLKLRLTGKSERN